MRNRSTNNNEVPIVIVYFFMLATTLTAIAMSVTFVRAYTYAHQSIEVAANVSSLSSHRARSGVT